MEEQLHHLKFKVKKDSVLARAAQFLKQRMPQQDLVLKLTVDANDSIKCRIVDEGPRAASGATACAAQVKNAPVKREAADQKGKTIFARLRFNGLPGTPSTVATGPAAPLLTKVDVLRSKLVENFLAKRRRFAQLQRNCVIPVQEIDELAVEVREHLIKIYEAQGTEYDEDYLQREVEQIMDLAMAFPRRPDLDVRGRLPRMNG